MVIDDQMKDSLSASIKEYLFLSWVEIQVFQSWWYVERSRALARILKLPSFLKSASSKWSEMG